MAKKVTVTLVDDFDGSGAADETVECAVLDAAPGVAVDYLELRDIGLGPMPLNGSGRLLVAARLGTTRLLDNIAIEIGTFAGTDRPDGYRAILESHWRN